jgi:hypothetical protein
MLTVRRLTIFLTLATLAAIPAQALAGPDQALAAGVAAPSRGPLRQEIVGVEVHTLSLAQGDGVSSRPSLGLGAMFRLGRHRWSRGYLTPIQAGVFVGNPTESGPDVISARVMTEGGAIFRGDAGVLELGLGAGAGILAIVSGNGCDGSCNVGGKGVILSPVARLVFRESTHVPIGIVLRGEVPVATPTGAGWGYFTGYGTQVMVGLDVGVGL